MRSQEFLPLMYSLFFNCFFKEQPHDGVVLGGLSLFNPRAVLIWCGCCVILVLLLLVFEWFQDKKVLCYDQGRVYGGWRFSTIFSNTAINLGWRSEWYSRTCPYLASTEYRLQGFCHLIVETTDILEFVVSGCRYGFLEHAPTISISASNISHIWMGRPGMSTDQIRLLLKSNPIRGALYKYIFQYC